MSTTEIEDFKRVVWDYLQPVLLDFMDILKWGQLLAHEHYDIGDETLDELNAKLDGLTAQDFISELVDDDDRWTPKYRLWFSTEIKNQELYFFVHLVKSEITAIEIDPDSFPEELHGIDLAREFGKARTFSILARQSTAEG